MMHIEEFESVDEFRNALNTRKKNPYFNNNGSHDHNFGFSETYSYEEADELMRKGYAKGLEDLLDGKPMSNLNYRGVLKRGMPHSGIVGFAPIVPNAILGLPNSMITSKVVPMKAKVITINVDSTVNSKFRKEDIIKGGRTIIKMIDRLEREGHRVNLDIIIGVNNGSNAEYAVKIKLKDARHPIDLLKISYPIIHPSFVRRHFLRYLETHPTMPEKHARNMCHGYGCPISNWGYEREKRRLEENNIVDGKNSFFCSIIEASSRDENELIKFLNIK